MKYLYRLHDGALIESVLMRYKYGYTLCVSSQVGCKMGCSFCASTIGGFVRNLAPSEMLGQIYAAQRDWNVRVSHVVLMGMGEPLDNFENVLRFLQLATDVNGLNLSMRNISLSTCGIVPGIEKLLEYHLQLTLSVSLHAPNDAVRSRIMPVNHRWGVDELLHACRRYAAKTSRRISFEYAMIQDVNDSDACALELARRLRGMLCHVNLIPATRCGRMLIAAATGAVGAVCKAFGAKWYSGDDPPHAWRGYQCLLRAVETRIFIPAKEENV